MSWQAVARKDFQDAIRSRSFLVISVLFGLLALGVAISYGVFTDVFGGERTVAGLVFLLANAISLFIVITAILVCYKSVAGERESGSIKLLLSLPHSRRDVIVGKIAGRTGVLAVPTIGGLLLGVVVGSALIGQVDPVATALLLVVGLFFALTFVSAMVGLSAMTGSSSKAAALTLGVFFVFELLWDVVTLVLVFVASGFTLPSPASYPAWIYPIMQVPPTSAFLSTLNAVIPGGTTTPGAIDPNAFEAFYASPWIGLVVLLVWLTIPALVGTRMFAREDL